MGTLESPPPEARKIPRRHPRVRLVTQVESRTSGQSSIGRTENISEGGMLVLSRDTFEPQTDVIVRFNLPLGRTVQAEGIVVHTQPGVNMGIHFHHINQDDLSAIKEFVRQACEEPGEA